MSTPLASRDTGRITHRISKTRDDFWKAQKEAFDKKDQSDDKDQGVQMQQCSLLSCCHAELSSEVLCCVFLPSESSGKECMADITQVWPTAKRQFFAHAVNNAPVHVLTASRVRV